MKRLWSWLLVAWMVVIAGVAAAAEKGNKAKPKVNRKSAGPPAVAKDIEKTFQDLDKDKNWKLNLDEFKEGKPDATAAEKQFKAMDKDHDGYVSLYEFKTAMTKQDPSADTQPAAKKDPKKDAKKAPKKDTKK
jgi:hypothetical protein